MIAVAVACAVVSAAATAPAETTVRERRREDIDDVRLDDDGGALGSDALLSVPGVSLVREGGPLSPVRPMVRGLSGSRLDVSVLGLPFVDPAAGFVDAALWPWMLGTVDVDVGAKSIDAAGLGGSVAFKRPAPGMRFNVTAGELSTLQLGGRAVDVIDDNEGLIGVAGSGGFTAGDFIFRPTDAGGEPGAPALRENNDQQRASLLTFADVGVAEGLRLRAGVVGAGHEGGIAGFSTQPLLTLRGRRALASGGLGLSWKGPVAVDVDTWASSSLRSTTTTTFPLLSTADADTLIGRRIGGRVKVKSDLVNAAGWGVDVGVAFDGAAADIPDVVRRQEAGAVVSVVARGNAGSLWGAPLVAFVDGDAGARVVDDVDAFLPTGSLRLGVARRGLLTFVGVTRAARAPTLDERFAPSGFVEGNPFLRVESVTDGELGVVVTQADGGRVVAVRAVGFVSRIDDAIAYVNRSAFSVVPVNTGAAGRIGVDLGGALRPIDGFAVDVTASLLSSSMNVTGAPLPQAPPFLLRTTATVGDAGDVGGGGLDVVVTSRGASSSNLFGTLVAPGFTLLDLVARYPLSSSVGLRATLQNVFDTQDVRDTNLLPLPGRLLFVGLEVKT